MKVINDINVRRGQYWYIIYTCPRNSGPPSLVSILQTNDSDKFLMKVDLECPRHSLYPGINCQWLWFNELTKQQLVHAVQGEVTSDPTNDKQLK